MNNAVLDALPSLSEDYPLTSEQIQEYHERGHVLIPNLVSQAELDAYRPHIEVAVERYKDHNLSTEQLKARQKNWIYLDNLWSVDTITGRLTLAPRFAKIAAQLLEVNAVRLYMNRVILKKPGAVGTPWHQDAPFFPMDTKKIVALWLPLVDVTPDMGMLIFAEGTHYHQQLLGATSVNKDEIQKFAESLFEQGYPLNACRYYVAGDAEFIDGWNLHYTTDNNSNRTRETLVVFYYPDDVCISQPRELTANTPISEQIAENFRQQTRITCFPGLQPGDLAVTPMNPLVYSRQRDGGGK